MSARTHNFRIGVFVLTGAALLVVALFAVGLKAYFGKRDIFETYVTGKVENLSLGALVKLRGVTIGKISSIDFAGTEYPDYGNQYVIIQFKVPRGTLWSGEPNDVQKMIDSEVARGLRARVQVQGLVGANILCLEYVDPELYPVEPIPWTPKHYYIPSAPGQFNSMFAALEKTLHRVQNVDFTNLLQRVDKLLDSANRLAENLNQVDFKGLDTNAVSLIADFRKTADDLQQTLSAAQSAINGADIPGLSRDASALLTRLSNAATELRRVLASLDVRALNESLANVRAASDDLIVLIHDLEQRPSSLVFSRAPHPVSEMEKPPKP